MKLLRRRGCHAAMGRALGVLLLALCQFGYAQTTGTERTWTDSSGRHKTEAAFVRLEGETVFLKLADGRVVPVPLARLSKVDREYAATRAELAARESSPVTDSLAALRAASVVVWQQQGERSFPLAGIVVRRLDDRAIVLFKSGKQSSQGNADEPVSYRVAVGDGAPGQRVSAEWFGLCCGGSHGSLALSADQLDAPLPTPADITMAKGQSVTVIGFQTNSGTPPSAVRYERVGTVHRVFRTLDGKVAHVRLEIEPPRGLFLVADDRGRFVGVLNSDGPIHPSLRHRTTAPPTRFSTMVPAEVFLSQLLEPYERDTSFARKSQQGEIVTFQFVVCVSDPFEQIRNPRLRIRARYKYEGGGVPWDADPRMIQTVVPPLELDRRRPDEELTGVLVNYSLYSRYTTLVADHKMALPPGRRLDGFFTQLVFETADGKTHYGPHHTLIELQRRR